MALVEGPNDPSNGACELMQHLPELFVDTHVTTLYAMNKVLASDCECDG